MKNFKRLLTAILSVNLVFTNVIPANAELLSEAFSAEEVLEENDAEIIQTHGELFSEETEFEVAEAVEADVLDEVSHSEAEESVVEISECSVTTLAAATSLSDVIFQVNKNAEELFFRIFHLDAGRKYFSADQIKSIIDLLAENQYTHLELALGNDALRFLLDDMSLNVNGRDYSSDAVTAGISSGNKAYYADPNGNYLTESEMDDIIAYAKKKNVGLIPMINTPGHMDAMIDAMEYVGIANPAYNGSARTVDVTNANAVRFTLALVEKYICYFAENGVKLFNMGCDEYANDKYTSGSMGFGNLISTGNYGSFVTFVNDMAAQIKKAGMTPVAFNDGIYFSDNKSFGTFDTDILIAYWTSGWTNYNVRSAADLAADGFRIINTNDGWYYVLGRTSGGYSLQSAKTAARDTGAASVSGSASVMPVGSMMCVWCDTPSAGYTAAEVNNIRDLIKLQAQNNADFFTPVTKAMWPAEDDPGRVHYATAKFVTGAGASAAPASQTVIKGEGRINRPSDPTRQGYNFAGWYADDVLFNFAEPLTENVTLTAKWNECKEHTYEDGKCTKCGADEPKPEPECISEKTVSLANGKFIFTLGGNRIGEFTFAKSGNGWTIEDEDGKYLAFANNAFTYSDSAFVWTYSNNAFTTSVTSSGSSTPWSGYGGYGGGGNWGSTTTTYYLTYSGGRFTASTSSNGSNAGFIKVIENPKHSFGNWTAKNGVHSRTCSVCGKDETGNCEFGEWTTVNGIHSHTCSICLIEDSGKCSYTKWTTEDEVHSRTCTVCHAEETGGCSYGNWTPDENGQHSKTCSVCGEKISQACGYGADHKCTVCSRIDPEFEKPVAAVVDKINAIGTVAYTAASKALINAARSAYNALTADQRKLVTTAQLKVLTDAEDAYAKLGSNHDAATAVVEKINAIGTVVYTTESKAKIDAARSAYNALATDQKNLVTTAQLKVLTDAEAAYAKLGSDHDAATAVVEKINAIGTVAYTTESKAKIDAARSAYSALSTEQRKLVPTAQLKALTDAETAYGELKTDHDAASSVVEKINAIGTVAYTTASRNLIDAARSAYNALTADQKKLVTSAQLKVLTDAEETYAKLGSDQEAATAVVDKINAIGTVAYTTAIKGKIDVARSAYNALTADQKKLVTSAQLKMLTDAEEVYAKLGSDQDAATAVIEKINAIGTVAYTEASKALINAARSAYNALTADQRKLVTSAQLKVLTDAEEKYDFYDSEKYTVTWMNWNGSILETDEDVAYGTIPKYNGATPTKPADAWYSYIFAGWDKAITAVTGDATYTAVFTRTVKQYKVSFDANGHGSSPAAITVSVGQKITKPADPSASSYTFGGWYKEASCTNEWRFDTDLMPSKDITLYAKWTYSGGKTGVDGGGSSSGGSGGGGGSSSGGSGGGSAGGPGAKSTVVAGAPTFSKNWVADAAGVWRIRDKAGNYVTSAWLCDDAVTTNGQNVWYLMNTDGTMLAAGLVQDNTGNYYSLETNHNGYYGMLRYVNGTYDGIYMEFSQKHDGTFGAITNQSAIDALKAKYGVTRFGIGNDRCVYTKSFE